LQHPEQISSVLNRDASYVFFRFLKGNHPLGSERISLSPRRSLAVDTHYIPLGLPIWLDTMIPQDDATTPLIQYKHLMIAQDTGGSIKGIVRGDVYFGVGDEAAFIAGHMKSKGQYWILLPRK
jgi:membrane-bound lytic murein transglycosylase A